MDGDQFDRHVANANKVAGIAAVVKKIEAEFLMDDGKWSYKEHYGTYHTASAIRFSGFVPKWRWHTKMIDSQTGEKVHSGDAQSQKGSWKVAMQKMQQKIDG